MSVTYGLEGSLDVSLILMTAIIYCRLLVLACRG